MRERLALFASLVLMAGAGACGPSSGGGGGGGDGGASTGDGGTTNGDGGTVHDLDGSTCQPNCDQEGERVCSTMGTKVRECRQVAPGCLRWDVAEDCAGQGKLCDDTQDPPACVFPPTCDDGIQNQDETDVDCGGSCDPCPAGSQCTEGEDCESGLCENGTCLLCPPGQYRCTDNTLEQCAGDGMSWQHVQDCDVQNQQGCDAAAGQCHRLPRIGNGPDNPTGIYYQFAYFEPSVAEYGTFGNDVDSLGDLIFINRGGQYVDVYKITLLDSDGDGKLEPNQHPDNPDNPNDIEERQIEYVTTYEVPIGGSGSNELYVTDDTIYYFNPSHGIRAYDIASGNVSNVAPAPGIRWGSRFQVLGYDEVGDLWYSATRDRYVFSFNPATGVWVWEFSYPDLAGSHNDGMEVVVDPNTGIPYVYVSDMTSNYIAQYHQDEFGRWTQVNLFQYNQPQEVPVEGMGFGALNHFWCTAGALYEIGGGDLAQYTEPFDPTHQ